MHLLFLVFAILVALPIHAAEPPTFVTRAETAMILLKSRLGGDIQPVASGGAYPDIAEGSWHERYLVLAARYRIIEPQTRTSRMRPDDVVFRSEFLTMLQRTFGLPTGLPHLYTDVSPHAWYAPVAGIAARYGLFPGDADRRRLFPESLMTHGEMARALQILLRQLDFSALPSLPEHTAAAARISTVTDRVTLVQVAEPRLISLPPTPLPPAGIDLSTLPALRTAVLNLVNIERTKAGLRPLIVNATLQQSAQRYAEEMLTYGFFSHTDPQGRTLRDRMETSGYQRSFYDQTCFCALRAIMGENIAQGQKTATEVVRDWMQSPSHKAAILAPGFTDTGIGIRSGVWVQHFGGMERTFELTPPLQ